MKNDEEVDNLIILIIQIEELKNDFSEFTKRKSSDPVNKFKMNLVNSLLEQVNNVISEKHKPFEEFELFNIDEIPINSDVLLILNQYLSGIRNFAYENIIYSTFNYYWTIDGKQPQYRQVDDISLINPRKGK